MELTVLNGQIVTALTREIEEVKSLITEIISPYRSLQKEELWMDGSEVCQLLGISKRTLQSYRAKGILPYTQICRKNFFRQADIRAYLERKTIAGKSNLKNNN